MRIGGSALPSMSLVEAPYKDMLGFACGMERAAWYPLSAAQALSGPC